MILYRLPLWLRDFVSQISISSPRRSTFQSVGVGGKFNGSFYSIARSTYWDLIKEESFCFDLPVDRLLSKNSRTRTLLPNKRLFNWTNSVLIGFHAISRLAFGLSRCEKVISEFIWFELCASFVYYIVVSFSNTYHRDAIKILIDGSRLHTHLDRSPDNFN